MDKIEKSKARGNSFQAHCFPDLHGTAPTHGAGEDAPCDIFQPLYDSGSGKSAYRASCALSPSPDQDQIDDKAERQKKSHKQGITAGQKDALCLVQQEMEPGLKGFVHAVNQLNEHLAHVTAASSRNIIQLALEIVRKIMDDDPSIDDKDLTSVHQQILGAMDHTYGLDLQMNSDDFANLSSILQCEPSLSLMGEGVRLTGDSQMRKGAFSLNVGDQALPIDSITQKLTQVLERFPST